MSATISTVAAVTDEAAGEVIARMKIGRTIDIPGAIIHEGIDHDMRRVIVISTVLTKSFVITGAVMAEAA